MSGDGIGGQLHTGSGPMGASAGKTLQVGGAASSIGGADVVILFNEDGRLTEVGATYAGL